MSTLNIEGLSWALDTRSREPRWLLRDIGLHVGEGEFVGLIGPNGSGKTSLLRCAYRSTQPACGHLQLDGEDLWRRSPRWSAQRIAVVLQEFPQEFGLTAGDIAAMGRTPHKALLDGDSREDATLVAEALRQVGLGGRADHAFARLSGGEKQRVLLARALVQQPGLLILDEPTNHLDPRYQLELLQHLRRLRLSTLASFHDLNLAAAFCDRLYVIDQGRLVTSGAPSAVLTGELLHEVFGVRALVDSHPLHAYPRITWITQP
ncbi:MULTISPECIES: ABC transporter ATP-binding protein [unclassified Pseudomonas]|uniref:ABC transporter ATP-binding protein n=1 Tax=unclassified Pseudomonas TaxID=196821 RepID=UPI00095D9DD6|nr:MULTISPECIES: ABC transporter ATP-binding protein [unclassified Pseudomonas]OLU17591.1 histidinol phosphatase [Pseudomonas sp. PA1(2017)]OLU30604.1 histidinol phosphatase [Pseudomonas sp. PA27(2017)]